MGRASRLRVGFFCLATGCYQGIDTGAIDTDGSTGGSGDAGDATAASGSNSSTGASSSAGTTAGSTAGTTASSTSAADTTGASASESATDASAGSESTGGDAASQVCERWSADRADMSEGAWSGSVGACTPGDIADQGRVNALRVLNLYRWLAGLPAITLDENRNQLGQACALMMDANDDLSHTPPTSWTCYSGDGAMAAGNSNIATTPAVASIDLYMVDPGNPDTLGHRRWILSNSIGPTGIGSTDGYSCLWTLGGSGNAGAAWTAYPSPGPYPFEASTLGWTSLDETGWSIQSDSIELGGAQVTITQDGEDRPVTVHALGSGYGSSSAISMIPIGWQLTAGASYHVSVANVGTPIEYDVDVVDCG
ncbi:MAG: CAP domain-containing protein [Deltaproteobacteria bacterium]|nr:CAP domain-containing protein [Deltaproteobacteria bacterium]MBK8239790.1 CAP domain-containing protein [Deltaproteobacteria bacterium]MBK8714526.1 CAP domain-containing protein [Deltaproteobacteria bacterium]MBP7288279.1 CAP domain-containing protein [Nannocystaceae bacterium]